ncbi:MAG: LacI family transcriptional regulator [Tenacibaculum sp.]|nr:LacI family transcriptional regulator [Tenacibaculum sp.]
MVTLRKISHITGFSISTVSKALNDGMDVSFETKKYIQRVAVQNNYIPNKAAISLRKSKSNIISIIVPKINEIVFAEVLCDIQKLASKSGYRIMLYQSLHNVTKEEEFIKEINDGSVDAAIIISTTSCEIPKENTIPVKVLKIRKNYNCEEVKNDCINNFNQLLKQIA